MTVYRIYSSPVGTITLAGQDDAITGLWFEGQKFFGATMPPGCQKGDLPVFRQAEHWLELYFTGKAPDFTPPLSFSSTPFRMAVWNALLTIPYGQTVTYGDIARQLGLPLSSARAVGGAVGRNPISLFIPCHRVVGSGGSLTGYAGGLGVKSALLRLEGIHL